MSRLIAAETTEPTPAPGSTVTSSGAATEGDAYEVWAVADGQLGMNDAIVVEDDARERALVEAGRLYGRDHARARAALRDGTHPLSRLKRPAG